MEGECIGLSAVQGYYPPRLQFDVRLKNNTGNFWYVFSYGGLLRATKEKIDYPQYDLGVLPQSPLFSS